MSTVGLDVLPAACVSFQTPMLTLEGPPKQVQASTALSDVPFKLGLSDQAFP